MKKKKGKAEGRILGYKKKPRTEEEGQSKSWFAGCCCCGCDVRSIVVVVIVVVGMTCPDWHNFSE